MKWEGLEFNRRFDHGEKDNAGEKEHTQFLVQYSKFLGSRKPQSRRSGQKDKEQM